MAFRGLLLALLMFPGLVTASKGIPDYLELTRVSDRVYSAIGATAPRDVRKPWPQQQSHFHHHAEGGCGV